MKERDPEITHGRLHLLVLARRETDDGEDLRGDAKLLAGVRAEPDSHIAGVLEELLVECDQFQEVMGRDHDVDDRQDVALFAPLDRLQPLPGGLLVGGEDDLVPAPADQVQQPDEVADAVVYDKDAFRFAHDILLAPAAGWGNTIRKTMHFCPPSSTS